MMRWRFFWLVVGCILFGSMLAFGIPYFGALLKAAPLSETARGMLGGSLGAFAMACVLVPLIWLVMGISVEKVSEEEEGET